VVEVSPATSLAVPGVSRELAELEVDPVDSAAVVDPVASVVSDPYSALLVVGKQAQLSPLLLALWLVKLDLLLMALLLLLALLRVVFMK